MKFVKRVTLIPNSENVISVDKGTHFLVKNFGDSSIFVSLGTETLDEDACIQIPASSYQECFISEEFSRMYQVDELHLKSSVAAVVEIQVTQVH